MGIRAFSLAALVAATLAVAACAPDPAPPATPAPADTSAPTPVAAPTPEAEPEAAAPVLSPDGFGPLVIGAAVDPGAVASLVAYDERFCIDLFAANGLGDYPADRNPARWTPTGVWDDDAFSVQTRDGIVTRVDTHVPGVATAEGIQVGSTADEVVAAYPNATVSERAHSDVYVVAGHAGLLLIEVARDTESGYWRPDELDLVLVMNASLAEFGVFHVAGTDNWAGEC